MRVLVALTNLFELAQSMELQAHNVQARAQAQALKSFLQQCSQRFRADCRGLKERGNIYAPYKAGLGIIGK